MENARLISAIAVFLLILPAVSSGIPSPVRDSKGVGESFGYRVVFDRSYGQLYSIYDTGFCGYSTLAKLIENRGYKVFESIAPISETVSNLSSADILFLGVAKNTKYSDEDVNAVLSFLQRGGKAIIVGEHTDTYGMATFQNRIAKHLGAEFLYSDIIEKDPKRGIAGPEKEGVYGGGYIWFLAHGVGPLSGLKDIPIYDAAPIEIRSSNVTAILEASESSEPNNVVAAIARYGNGKAVLIGDSEVFWNGDGNISINYKNGTEFAERLLDLLVPSPVKIEAEYDLLTSEEFSLDVDVSGNFTSIDINSSGVSVNMGTITSPGKYTIEGKVYKDGYIDFIENNFIVKRIYLFKPPQPRASFRTLIDESGHARRITENPDSLVNFARILRDSGSEVFASQNPPEYGFDSYVVMNPLESMEYPWLKEKNARILVAGDMHTELLDKEPWDILKKNGYRAKKPPVNEISERFGISFSKYLATCGEKYKNPFFLNATHTFGFSFPTYNAAVLHFTEGHILANGESGSWGELYDFFGYNIVKDSSDSTEVYLMGYNKRIMVLGCGESLTDRFSNYSGWRTLAESVADWLNFKYIKKDGHIEVITTSRAKKASYILKGIKQDINLSSSSFNISLEKGTSLELKIYYGYEGGKEGAYYNEIYLAEKPKVEYPIIYVASFIIIAVGISILLYTKSFKKKR